MEPSNNPQKMQFQNPSPVTFAAPARTNTLAVVSLVLALVSMFVGIVVPLVLQIGAVVCGHIARGQIRRSSGAEGGDGMALAGLIIGYIALTLGTLAMLFIGGSILALLGLSMSH